MTIKQHLLETTSGWRKMGHPNLFEEFLVRNGTERLEFTRPKTMLKKQECFKNSMQLALQNNTLRYCEGLAWRRGLCVPIHHGWLFDTVRNIVIEPTWGPPNRKFATGDTIEYLGYEFPSTRDAWTRVLEAGYYGLFVNGMGFYNHKLMIEIDPGLAEIPGLEALKTAA